MAENVKEEEQAAEKPPEKSSKLIPIFLIANSVLMLGVLAVVLLRKPSTPVAMIPAPRASANLAGGTVGGKEGGAKSGEAAGHGESATPANPGGAPGPILKLENFIIQLRSTDTDRYVRVAFDLELGEEADRPLVQARMSQIRDGVISYFSDRSLDELRGSEGMERIKQAVGKKLDEILLAHQVKSVFITELVIQ